MNILKILMLVIMSPVFAAGLPDHPNKKSLSLIPVGVGQEIFVSATVLLPLDHKFNKGAPSAIDVYEKRQKGWEKSASIDLKSLFQIGNQISVQHKVNLKEKNELIALDATLYHCRSKNTHCVIESFQGIAQRNNSPSSNLLKANLIGTSPK